MLTVTRGGKQGIDALLVGVGRRVCHEGIDLGDRRGEAGQRE